MDSLAEVVVVVLVARVVALPVGVFSTDSSQWLAHSGLSAVARTVLIWCSPSTSISNSSTSSPGHAVVEDVGTDVAGCRRSRGKPSEICCAPFMPRWRVCCLRKTQLGVEWFHLESTLLTSWKPSDRDVLVSPQAPDYPWPYRSQTLLLAANSDDLWPSSSTEAFPVLPNPNCHHHHQVCSPNISVSRFPID